jgi:hypothetical protein
LFIDLLKKEALMLRSAPYTIRTVEEAVNGGYTQVSELHAPVPDPFFETIDRVRHKVRWLYSLTPDKKKALGPYLHMYGSILRYSFIIVDQQDYPEYMQKSSWDRYCFWRRDITRDN